MTPMGITDLIEREYGSRNWVLARRTSAILARYGADVVTLSRGQLEALQKRFEIETADRHAAMPALQKLLGAHCDAVNTIRYLRAAGFRIERCERESRK